MKPFRIFRISRLFAWLLLIILLSVPTQAQEPGLTETFDNPALPGWEHSSNVAVVDGVLRLETGGFAFHGGEWSDLMLTIRARHSGEGATIVSYRASDTGTYLILVENNHLALQREADSVLVELGDALIEVASNEWFQIGVTVTEREHIITLDDETVLTATDPDPLPPGGIAFESIGEGISEFDDLSITSLGMPLEEPPAPTPSEPASTERLTWVRTGGPLGGLGYDVRMRPDNPDTMYVTDAWAGVHISVDGGQTWFPSNEGITTRVGESGDAIPVFCLTIDPHDYDTIWVGTQNVRGIFKSTDGGRTWVEKDNGVVEYDGITFRGFTVDPNSTDIVYAAAEISSWQWAGEEQMGREFDMTQGVVYKTTDGGDNWSAVWRGDNLARYVWIDSRDSNVIYISTGIFDREAANSVPASRTPGGVSVVKSTDGGQTWTEINKGLSNSYVGSLFMHPENPDILLAGTGNNQYYDGAGAYLSTDGGASWQQTLDRENINAVEFALSDPQIAYAGSADAVYRSEDGGHTWQRVSGGDEQGWGSPGVRAGFPIDFQVDPRDPNRIFTNNYGGGNFLSTDGGRTWTVASKGYTGAQVRDIAVDSTGRVFAAARSGIFVSSNGGDDWVGLNTPPAAAMEWYGVAVDPTDSQHVLAANNWNGVILQSRNAGDTWQLVSKHAGGMMSWRAIAFAPSEPETVYAGTSAFYSAGTFDERMPAGGIYVSQDGGETWTAANDTTSQDANVTDLAVDPRNPQVVYAASGNLGLLKSTDGGQSWTAINQGLPESPTVLAVAIHPVRTDAIYAGLAFGGLYHSEDGGVTWQMSAGGMPPEAILSDVIFDSTNPQTMYAADRFSGVYRSTDGGATWLPLNNNLRTRAVNKLAISTGGQHLYAATEGEGVFRLDLKGEPPVSISDSMIEVEEPAVDESVVPTPIPEPAEGGGGICGGTAALPLALLGLVWIHSRKR